MEKENQIYLEDIRDSIVKIKNYTRDMDAVAFEQNSSIQDAVMRRLEIIGEAVKHLSADIKNQYPEIPWREIAGMRDVFNPRIRRCATKTHLANH